MLLSKCATDYIEGNKQYLKERTIFRYNQQAEHLIKIFGDVDIGIFTQDYLQNYINEEQAKGKAKKSVQRIIYFLTLIIRPYIKFERFRYIITDKDNQKKKIYSFEDIAKIERYIMQRNKKSYIPIMLAIHTGMRTTEIAGLRWGDVDFENRTITVCRNVCQIGKENIVTSPKTVNSYRKIPINETLMSYLGRLDCAGDDYYVVTNELKPRLLRTVHRSNELLCKKIGVQPCGMHAYRHAFATRLLKTSQDYKAISEIMGHSKITITQDVYNHPTDEQRINVVDCAFGMQEKKEHYEQNEIINTQIAELFNQIRVLQNQINLLTQIVEHQSSYIKPKFRIVSAYGNDKVFTDEQSLLGELDISSRVLKKHLNGDVTILDSLGVEVQRL